MSHEEMNLIRQLREKLGVHERTQRMVLAQLDHFPGKGNRLHSPSNFRE